MYPYNEKLWGCELEEMNTTWVRARFPKINVEELKQQIAERKVIQWGDNANFRYPVNGGCGGVWTKLGEEILPQYQLNKNHKIKSIDPLSKMITFENGMTCKYEKLVSSIPITYLLKTLNVDDPYLNSIDTSKFIYSSAYIVGFGIEGP